MSDAITDIARDEQRARNFSEYLSALRTYLMDSNSSRKNFTKVIEAARSTDAIRRGYWGGQTSISENIEKKIKKLKKNDKTEWARLLAMTMTDWPEYYGGLKKLSPFKEKYLHLVDYGNGFMDVYAVPRAPFKLGNGTINRIIASKNMKIYDADDYLIAISKSTNPCELADLADSDNHRRYDQILQTIDVIWLRCGIVGINGPRPAK